MSKARFDPGRFVLTRGAQDTLNNEDVASALSRHIQGDWGDLGPEDWGTNDHGVDNDLRILSSYKDRHGTKFWIITEADRSYTTVLLPEEY